MPSFLYRLTVDTSCEVIYYAYVMRILGIETSCDESAVAYLDVHKGKVRSLEHLVASQMIHEQYGGVVPEVAAREHVGTLPLLLDGIAKKVIGKKDGNALGKKVDVIAVTQGPGLVTSVRVGLDTARTLASAWKKDLIGINHLEGHIYANWLPGGGFAEAIEKDKWMFPALVLIVSGGHTELLLMKGHGKYTLLGATRDDAAGETFDKVAKLLGLGYPGGPLISAHAEKGDRDAYDFPRPMITSPQVDFSFSGLKTAVLYFLRKQPAENWGEQLVNDVAASAEKAIVDVLVTKTARAARMTGAKTVVLAGGVAANSYLRQRMGEEFNGVSEVHYVQPHLKYCTDNAAMIAMAGYFNSVRGKTTNWKTADVKIGWGLGR